MAVIMEGGKIAAAIDEQTAGKVAMLRQRGVHPTLAVVRAGTRDDDGAYERSVCRSCERTGIAVRSIAVDAHDSQGRIEATMTDLSADGSVHGVLLLGSFSDQAGRRSTRASIDAAKDVDGMTSLSFARVYTGYGEGFVPCVAEACMRLLDGYGVECEGKHVVVLGHSLSVGRPIAMMLLAANATPTICHMNTVDAPAIARKADIVIVATGLTQSIGAEYFSSGQTVVDVGIGRDRRGWLCGDVVFEEAAPVVHLLTPVPGGVGLVTASVLADHVARAAEAQLGG